MATPYNAIRSIVDRSQERHPVLPTDPLDGRGAAAIANANPDFVVVNAAAQRILQSAFVTVVEDDPTHARAAMAQLASVFDDGQWPPWIDQAHVRFGHPVDLRTGMLAEAIGLGYDWLYPYLTASQRSFIVDGLDRRAIRPFKVAIGQDPWWLRDRNNWMTTIVGGLGTAGMALRDAHQESDFLIRFALDHMEDYLTIYGPNGEFNESVAYGNATKRPVALFQAHRYWSGGSENRLASHPFPDASRWVQYLTVPPGYVAAFGDAHTHSVPWTSHIAAIASATQDPALQWFHETYGSETTDPVAFLWYDASLESRSPAEMGWPLGRAFPAHGGCLVARTDWAPDTARCVVYGKAAREENHEHNDVGQLCIDALGERLVVDLGSPSGYPEDFFDEGRYEYYNASVRGHNVLMFDGEEMRIPTRVRGEPIGDQAISRSGRIVTADFRDGVGALWVLDCSAAYDDVLSVTRTVMFLEPGVIVVLDEAHLPRERDISLRWHTAKQCSPDALGAFAFDLERSGIVGQISSLSYEIGFRTGQHAYKAPFDRSRDGDPLEQRREPFVEAFTNSDAVAILTLFYAGPSGSGASWNNDDGTWVLDAPDVRAAVTVDDQQLSLSDLNSDRAWKTRRRIEN
jgi:hypothetical protein